MQPLTRLVLLASAVLAVAPAAAASDPPTTQIVQQRMSDGRILLTDRPAAGAKTERTWQVPAEDPAAARQRALDVRAEAQQVSERIQRLIEQERRADEENQRTRIAALALDQQRQHDDTAVYDYGWAVGGVPLASGRFAGGRRGHSRFDDRHGQAGHGHGMHAAQHMPASMMNELR
ncbi:MAG TPA: hypothetical protein VGI48_06450 [Caldimonas sp.]